MPKQPAKSRNGPFLDGQVTAVVGTHTHVQTADAKILPNGTAFITDIGMTGAEYSILGRKVEDVVKKFRTGMPMRLPVEDQGIRMDGVIIDYDPITGKASSIKNFSRMAEF